MESHRYFELMKLLYDFLGKRVRVTHSTPSYPSLGVDGKLGIRVYSTINKMVELYIEVQADRKMSNYKSGMITDFEVEPNGAIKLYSIENEEEHTYTVELIHE